MGLEEVLSITGKPGLFKLKTKARSGFLVESLLNGKTSIIGINHNVSVLKDISIYTHTAEVPLKEVFKKMSHKEKGAQAIDHKSTKNDLKDYFATVLPDYDEDRVYASDIKKIVQWYNLLQSHDMLNLVEEE